MRTWRGFVMAGILMLLSAVQVAADVTFNLSPTTINANPGDLFTLSATIVNQTGGVIFLNGGSGVINGPDSTAITFDDSAFLANMPLSLADTQTYQNNLGLQIAPNAPAGTYTFTYTVNGNLGDPSQVFAASDSAIILSGSSTAVPEMGSFALLSFGLVGLGISLRRRPPHSQQV